MGGCRCTYRNCTVKSNGQTHMFHYPVFEKVRCHQWLTNAQRLDFLDLKVSQLKNRVICQYHFKDEYFMNFRKEKLTFDAVPTENGPFCEPSDNFDPDIRHEKANIFPEEIENELLSCVEKQANYSVKYGDFLTSSNEVLHPFLYYIDQPKIIKNRKNLSNTTIHQLPEESKYNATQSSDNTAGTPNYSYLYNKISIPPEDNKKQQMQPVLIVQPFSNDGVTTKPSTQNNIFLEFNIGNQNNKQNAEFPVSGQNESITKVVPSKNKIKILSQKKIFEPLPIKASAINLRPVSPSIILCPKKKDVDAQSLQECDVKPVIECAESKPSMQEVNVEFEFLDKSENIWNTNVQQVESNTMPNAMVVNERQTEPSSLLKRQIRKNDESSSPLATLVKNTMPPERVAAIEEKRKFNKLKLKDMIEFCLDELDAQDQKVTEKSPNTLNDHRTLKNMSEEIKSNKYVTPGHNIANNKEKNIRAVRKENRETLIKNSQTNRSINREKVASFLSKEPNLPSAGEYNLASIEARMKRMEDILLKKIDQNAQRIVDLKHSLATSCEKKSVCTQTSESEVSYKRHLFNEISKFLSADANSLIYEELFINKYAQSFNKSSDSSSVQDLPEKVQPPKRRKRR